MAKVKAIPQKKITIDLGGSYLIIRPNPALTRLNGQAGEVFCAGQSDVLAGILFEAMKSSEFIRIVVHYANEEYVTKCMRKRDDDPNGAIVAGSNQLALSLAV